jgi:hypothetical protein
MCISVRARTPDLCSYGWIHFGSGRSGDMGTAPAISGSLSRLLSPNSHGVGEVQSIRRLMITVLTI